jgi:hypothetical protein
LVRGRRAERRWRDEIERWQIRLLENPQIAVWQQSGSFKRRECTSLVLVPRTKFEIKFPTVCVLAKFGARGVSTVCVDMFDLR